jgi:hypothetical protein
MVKLGLSLDEDESEVAPAPESPHVSRMLAYNIKEKDFQKHPTSYTS